MHNQSPILKTKEVLINPVILTYLQTKLHPPCPNQTACLVYQFRSEKCLQYLKNVGLYNSCGVGRFSFWQSWLTRASRLANSQASALNAGVSTDPYSNYSYLAHIWSVKELYSLWASCTVIKKTGFGMTDWSSNFNVICNVRGVEKKHVFTQSKFKSQLRKQSQNTLWDS